MYYPNANVDLRIGDKVRRERVAVAPKDSGAEERVVYALDLETKEGVELIHLLHEMHKEVLQVQT